MPNTLLIAPSWVVVVLLLMNVGVLAIWYHRTRLWTALALLIPMFYLAVVWNFIDTMDTNRIQFYSRWGFVVFLACQFLVFAQLAGVLPRGKRNGS